MAEADGIDGRSAREHGVGGEVVADFGELGGDIPEEGGGLVLGGVFVDTDVVDKGTRVDIVSELTD